MIKLIVILFSTFAAVQTAGAQESSPNALCNFDKTACVSSVRGKAFTNLTASLKQADGSFVHVDISPAESGNFAKLGSRRSQYNRFETKPVRWLTRQDGLLQVEIQTAAWRKGKRHVISELLVMRKDGKVLWR